MGQYLRGVIERDVVINIDQSQKVSSLHNFRSTGVEEIIFFISLRFAQFIIEKVVETLFPDRDPISLIPYGGAVIGFQIVILIAAIGVSPPVSAPESPDDIHLIRFLNGST